MKKIVFVATLFTANVQADIVGLYIGGQIWQSSASGRLGENNTLVDFNLEKQQQFNYFIAAEHPYPLLPNARISSTYLDTTGKTTLINEFSFGDKIFLTGGDINTRFNISYIDYTLYYELFDNDQFTFELGLTARDFNGGVTVTGTASNTNGTCNDPNPSPNSPCTVDGNLAIPMGKIKTNKIKPMLYIATNISLPLTGLDAFAQGDYLLIDDHSFYDYQIGLSYNLAYVSKMDFKLTLGYRSVKMKFKDLNSLYTDLTFKGSFVGVIAHF